MSVYIRNYDMAAEYLAGGRMKNKYRPISTNVYLARVSEDSIALVLHNTAIVTYYSNKTAVVYTDGWWSVTTKKKISEFTRLRAWGTGKYGVWDIGSTGEVTPAKVQKCRARGSKWEGIERTCKGTGTIEKTTRCDGPDGNRNHHYYAREGHKNICTGNVICDGESYEWGTNDDGSTNYSSDFKLRPCKHGETDQHVLEQCAHDVDPIKNRSFHFIEACEHGQWNAHRTGAETVDCTNCSGTGLYDYGSKPIPILWDNGCVRIDDDGHPIDLDTVITKMPWAPGRKYDYTISGYAPSSYPSAASYTPNPKNVGGSLADDLARVLPGLDAPVSCPVADCTQKGAADRVRTTIIHLNDRHKWTREAIADWLDTLDVDLAFKVA